MKTLISHDVVFFFVYFLNGSGLAACLYFVVNVFNFAVMALIKWNKYYECRTVSMNDFISQVYTAYKDGKQGLQHPNTSMFTFTHLNDLWHIWLGGGLP